MYLQLELGGEWLTEAERRDNNSRNNEWRARQYIIRVQQANDFERLNDALNPVWPLDMDDAPPVASLGDDDSSLNSGDLSVESGAICGQAPERASLPPPCPLPSSKTPHKLPIC